MGLRIVNMGVISNGTTLLDAGALDSGIPTGAMTLIKTLTASTSATLDFLNGASNVVFDGTYDVYVFKFINIHPATNSVKFQFQADTGTNTNYNQAITSTMFESYHAEGDGAQGLGYEAGHDQAQGTGFETLVINVGSDNDQSISGVLRLFNPSSSVFVKHFMSTINCSSQNDNSQNDFKAGYFNTTTALTRVRFKMSSGNIDSGTIKLYGIT
jgi:hypothetical protein